MPHSFMNICANSSSLPPGVLFSLSPVYHSLFIPPLCNSLNRCCKLSRYSASLRLIWSNPVQSCPHFSKWFQLYREVPPQHRQVPIIYLREIELSPNPLIIRQLIPVWAAFYGPPTDMFAISPKGCGRKTTAHTRWDSKSLTYISCRQSHF